MKLALEIATGMELIHAKDIIHFDLKPGKTIKNNIWRH
jgi:serine/threonine protein kinase